MKSIQLETGLKSFDKKLNRVFGKYREAKYLRSFFHYKPSPVKKGKVLLYSALGSGYNRHLEVLMYHLLKKEGYEVDYFICKGDLPACEILTKYAIEKIGKEKCCQRCSATAMNTLDGAGIKPLFIQDVANVDHIIGATPLTLDQILSFKYDDIDFGDIVSGVLYRYYQSLSFGAGADQVGLRYLKAALMNYLQVKTMQEKNTYDYFFFSHGIYSTWQPVVEFCHKYKVKYVCYDRAKKIASANFNINNPSPIWDISDAWLRYADRSLNAGELARVDDYLQERELQKNDVYAYNLSSKAKDLEKLKATLGIAEGAKVITVYTNLIWDAANVSRDIAFKSPLECIVKTVERYKNNKNVHILVRSHPAEKIIGTSERYGTLVKNSFKELPANLTVIEPDWDINSFSIIELSNIGVVHTSTVGLEMAIEGKPVILISDTHYRGKGFTFDATSEEHYFEALDKFVENPTPLKDQVQLAKKYFYMMMFEYQKIMPLQIKNNTFNGYKTERIEELSDKEELVMIVKELNNTARKDFIFWQ